MSSQFIIYYNSFNILIKTTLEESPEFLGQYLINKIKNFENHNETTFMKFVLEMIKEWELVSFNENKIEITNCSWYYIVKLDSDDLRFYVNYANKNENSKFKFFISEISLNKWVDYDKNEKSETTPQKNKKVHFDFENEDPVPFEYDDEDIDTYDGFWKGKIIKFGGQDCFFNEKTNLFLRREYYRGEDDFILYALKDNKKVIPERDIDLDIKVWVAKCGITVPSLGPETSQKIEELHFDFENEDPVPFKEDDDDGFWRVKTMKVGGQACFFNEKTNLFLQKQDERIVLYAFKHNKKAIPERDIDLDIRVWVDKCGITVPSLDQEVNFE